MTTDIVERADVILLVAQNDQAFAGYLGQKIITGPRDLALMPHQNPVTGKNLALLLGKDFARNKITLRQRLRPSRRSSSACRLHGESLYGGNGTVNASILLPRAEKTAEQ